MTDTFDLAAIKAALKECVGHTPGPWSIGFSDGSGAFEKDDEGAWIMGQDCSVDGEIVIRGGRDGFAPIPLGVLRRPDAHLITQAPHVPALLAEVERFTAECELVTGEYKENQKTLTELCMVLEYCEHYGHLVQEAKDLKAERDRLRGEAARLAGALKPFATLIGNNVDGCVPFKFSPVIDSMDVFAARAALAAYREGQGQGQRKGGEGDAE